MEEQSFEGFEFSWRRSYGFSSRLCPRQVLGFSASSSASSWIFLAKLAEDRTKNNENQVKSGGVWKGVAPPARAAEIRPVRSNNSPKAFENRAPNLLKSNPKRPKTMSKSKLAFRTALVKHRHSFWNQSSAFETVWWDFKIIDEIFIDFSSSYHC